MIVKGTFEIEMVGTVEDLKSEANANIKQIAELMGTQPELMQDENGITDFALILTLEENTRDLLRDCSGTTNVSVNISSLE